MKNYFEEKVTAIHPLDARRVRVVFHDGFSGEVDLAPLLGKGPLYEPLRTDESFWAVTVEHGVGPAISIFHLGPCGSGAKRAASWTGKKPTSGSISIAVPPARPPEVQSAS